MPSYDFYCPKCKKEVSVTATISQRERGAYACPNCGNARLEPLMASFFSKTSRKS
jgi:putative FmdB family regulatory protein